MDAYTQYFIICPLLFLGGFVDSIAGGGGLITLPAYLLAGLPPHLALGTNKFSSAIGTSISTARLALNGFIKLRPALICIVGAFISNLSSSSTQGGSTITQQLIKNTLLSSEQSYKRKIQEAYLAMQLEKTYTKEQILESYLNTIYLGESYYGDDKIVDVNIRRIRMKIEEEPSSPKYIITIWGYGYKWNDTQ